MSQQQPPKPEPNIAINGDEARLLIACLLQSTVSAPTTTTLDLFIRLNELSANQPPVTE